MAAVEARRSVSPIFSPNLQAMIVAEDAAMRELGLQPHTMEIFLLYLHARVPNPQAAHQYEAPQDHLEEELLSAPGRSRG
jgi:hypothetical protein